MPILHKLPLAISELDGPDVRTPIGMPLGYTLQLHHYVCTNCGSGSTVSELWTTERSVNSSGKAFHRTAAGETIYALPTRTTQTNHPTSRCIACLAQTARTPVPAMREAHANVGPKFAMGPTMEKHLQKAGEEPKPAKQKQYTTLSSLNVE